MILPQNEVFGHSLERVCVFAQYKQNRYAKIVTLLGQSPRSVTLLLAGGGRFDSALAKLAGADLPIVIAAEERF